MVQISITSMGDYRHLGSRFRWSRSRLDIKKPRHLTSTGRSKLFGTNSIKNTRIAPVATIQNVKATEPEQVTTIKPIVAQKALEPATQQISEADAKAFIYFKESSNRLDAINSNGGACGIGQSWPCSKLEAVCPNWKTDYNCQDQFFTTYVSARYGSWVGAYNFWINNKWY